MLLINKVLCVIILIIIVICLSMFYEFLVVSFIDTPWFLFKVSIKVVFHFFCRSNFPPIQIIFENRWKFEETRSGKHCGCWRISHFISLSFCNICYILSSVVMMQDDAFSIDQFQKFCLCLNIEFQWVANKISLQ